MGLTRPGRGTGASGEERAGVGGGRAGWAPRWGGKLSDRHPTWEGKGLRRIYPLENHEFPYSPALLLLWAGLLVSLKASLVGVGSRATWGIPVSSTERENMSLPLVKIIALSLRVFRPPFGGVERSLYCLCPPRVNPFSSVILSHHVQEAVLKESGGRAGEQR